MNGSTSTSSSVFAETEGTLGGSGTVGGEVTVAGTLAPGESPGTLNFSDNLILLNAATSSMEITGIESKAFYVLNGVNTNTLSISGKLALDNTGYTAKEGDTVTLFTNWLSTSGGFSSITGTDLGNGLEWDTSNLYSEGILTVIPEPSTTVLLISLLSLPFLLWKCKSRSN